MRKISLTVAQSQNNSLNTQISVFSGIFLDTKNFPWSRCPNFLTISAQLGSQCCCNSSNILECRVWRKLPVEAELTLCKHTYIHSCTHTGNTLEIHWKYTGNTLEIHCAKCMHIAHSTPCTCSAVLNCNSTVGLQIPSSSSSRGQIFLACLDFSPLRRLSICRFFGQ